MQITLDFTEIVAMMISKERKSARLYDWARKCGMPEDLRSIVITSDKPNGKNKKICADCVRIQSRGERSCINCGIKFMPGCRLTRTCPDCFNTNRNTVE